MVQWQATVKKTTMQFQVYTERRICCQVIGRQLLNEDSSPWKELVKEREVK